MAEGKMLMDGAPLDGVTYQLHLSLPSVKRLSSAA
jgi:hypothetical protein